MVTSTRLRPTVNLSCCLMNSAPQRSRPFPAWKQCAALLATAALGAGCATAGGHARPARAPEPVIAFNDAQCGGHWHATAGMRTFQVENQAGAAAEVYLINPASNAIFGAID